MTEVGTEKDYDDIRKLGTKLHIPTPEMHWKFKVELPDGEVCHEHDERGHSWVRNAYNVLVSQFCGVNGNGTMYGDEGINFVDVSGSVRNYSPLRLQYSSAESVGYGFLGTSGSNAYGIVVGTGLTPYHFDQYRLSMIVSNGTSTGQLSYQASNATIKNFDTVSRKYTTTFVRILNNNSSASITLNEVGIYFNIEGSYSGMAVRDVLGTPVTVPAGGKLTITYSICVTYPATTLGNTVHLINFDTTLDDEQGKQWTAYGSSSLSATQVKFGDKAYAIGGSNTYLTYPPSYDFQFGTGDFTFETFFYIPTSGCSIFGGTSTYAPFSISVSSNKMMYYVSTNQSSYNIAYGLSGTQTVAYNSWNHFALVRSGDTLYGLVNGVVDNTFNVAGVQFNFDSFKFYLGSTYPGSTYAGTYFDSFRISRVARYTGAYTVPTSAFVLD